MNLRNRHLVGRVDDAIALARQALKMYRGHKARGYEAWALRLLGDIAAHGDSPAVEPTAAHYRQALALAEELGIRNAALYTVSHALQRGVYCAACLVGRGCHGTVPDTHPGSRDGVRAAP